jgi:hypothetical protein
MLIYSKIKIEIDINSDELLKISPMREIKRGGVIMLLLNQ